MEPFPKGPNLPDIAICNVWKNTYKRSNNTTNLLDHLKHKYFTVLYRQNQGIEEEANIPGKVYNICGMVKVIRS